MSFSGQVVEIPLGTEGLTGSKNPSGVNPGYLVEATNVSFYDGTIRKEGGAAKYNSSAITGAPTILGGWDHYTNALAQRMIVACSDGKLYKDSGDGSFPVTLKSGLSTSPAMRPFFCDGGKEAAAQNRKLFIFTGTDVVQVLANDAATTSNIASPPADWSGSNQPTWGVIQAGRLMAGGNANDPHRVYISSATDHEDFLSDPISFSIAAGSGDGIVGAVSFRGLLVLWKKPLGIYVLNTNSPLIDDWFVHPVTRAIGGISPWAQVETDSDVIFLDSTGAIQSLRAVQEFGDVAGGNISQMSFMEPVLRAEFNLDLLNQAKGVYYPSKRELHFAYPKGSSTVNSSRLVLDFYRPDKIRFRISPRDICQALWLRRDTDNIPRIMAGDNAGFVWQLDQATRSKGGAGYASRAKTVPTDLGFAAQEIAHRVKNACFLELVYEPTTFNQVYVEVDWDGRTRQYLGFTLLATGSVLGSFVLGTAVLGASGYTTIRKRLHSGGKFVSLTFTNSNAAQDFSIARARLYFTLGKE